MPFIVRYPDRIRPGGVADAMTLNVDFAPTFMELAGIPAPEAWQGHSLVPILEGTVPDSWRTSMYYRYWMHLAHHNVYAHYGIRTDRYKLIYYYADALGTAGSIDDPRAPEWELFDLEKDPCEMNNVYAHPDYAEIVAALKLELRKLQEEVKDEPYTEEQ